jgi:hypothetical protein
MWRTFSAIRTSLAGRLRLVPEMQFRFKLLSAFIDLLKFFKMQTGMRVIKLFHEIEK